MNAQVLIDSVVRQATVLIAQLATSGGLRAPLAHLANQVFVELANELAAQGVSRKVSADMFGMALRAYIRKVRRLSAGQTDTGRTLWQAVLEFVRQQPLVTRTRVLERFARDGELEVSSVLHDLSESGLVFCSGSGRHAVYRAASDEELGQLSRLGDEGGLDEMAWVLVYRNGPLSRETLAGLLGRTGDETEALLQRLIEAGRVERLPSGSYLARDFVVELGAAVGWEAAVFDHFQAVVQTISQRLRLAWDAPEAQQVGGSTYSYDLWRGHPMEAEIKSQLSRMRQQCSALRERLEAHESVAPSNATREQVVFYAGQCVLDRELGDMGDDDEKS